MLWIGSLLFALIPRPDAVERLAPDFYGAVGSQVRVSWSVEPIDTTESRLTLIVRGAMNPLELTPPDLAMLPAWVELAPRLQVIPDGSPAPGRFCWRLRQKATGIISIPELVYRYYRPVAPDGSHFRVSYAESRIVPSMTPSFPAMLPRVRYQPRAGLPRWAWLVALPLAWMGCVVFMSRRENQDPEWEAILVELQAHALADPAGASANALRAALSLRLGAQVASRASGELPSGPATRVLADCDAARFGSRSAQDLPQRAAEAVRELARGTR